MAQDNDAPAIPANLTAEVGLTGIKLSWNHSPDADLSHYNIYRSETSGEGYVKIGETTSNNYQDTEGTVGTTYYYVLNAVDFSGNISGYAQEVSAVPVEAQILFGTDFENDNGGFVTGVTAGTANHGNGECQHLDLMQHIQVKNYGLLTLQEIMIIELMLYRNSIHSDTRR
ncbi:hypothetical protein CIW83_21745 [Tissierella sp. P1]|uniref:fibronectin type III domain-containing protein n=1 Tax=Tissierella sp. P1 TaxID=1280483 RepID=UPI000BA15EDE|nr:hypothetical protein [Tissierella sp. P1]OZV10175.1 hypothetical protein CIW83_21745 [Tissierella sp. P1]